MKSAKSYGILLFNDNKILLIRKRITYSFIEFVNGNYDMFSLADLFDKMTFQEKLIIQTFNFRFIWYHCNLNMQNNRFYKKAKKKFDLLQRSDIGCNLKYLINKSKNEELLWEIPKGRKRKTETFINTAIREFYEETNIKNTYYQLLPHFPPIIHSFIDDNVNYIYYYYISITSNQQDVSLQHSSNSMVFETSDIKYIKIQDLEYYLTSKKLIKDIKSTYKKIKQYY